MSEFEEFYLGSRARVLRTVALVAETDEDARDCVQEAYVRAAARWPVIRQETAEAWVRRVALNLALDGRRRGTARRRLALAVGPPDPVPEPSAHHLDVIGAVRQLPRAQQEVIVLHHLLDMSVADVARDLDRPENTVKTQLMRARARLEQLLDHHLEASHD